MGAVMEILGALISVTVFGLGFAGAFVGGVRRG